MVNNDESFKTVSWDTANLINMVTKSGFKMNENEEVADMCKAIMDIREEGREEERISSIRNLMESLALTAKQAMDILKFTPAEQQRYLKML